MSTRNQSLDVLRGIAVLIAISSHYPPTLHFRSVILEAGGCGVDLFFVISGFLISGLLFSEYKQTRSIRPVRFWIRRGFKIYPAFYVFVGVSITFFLIVTHAVPRQMLSESLFVQNYFPRVFPHTWSLAVEEHFYFALPLLFLLLITVHRRSENPFRLVPLISVCISVACMFFRISALRHGATWESIGFPTHLRMDALFAGVTLGYFAHFEQESFAEARRLWVLLIGVLFSLSLIVLPDVLRLSFAYLVFAFIVAWAGNHKKPVNSLFRPLAWVGFYSYSIYLWQMFVMMILHSLPAARYRLPLFLLLCVSLGVAMSKIVEIPALRLRDRLFPSGPKARAAQPYTIEKREPVLVAE